MSIHYRPEIDGLRTIAVSAVVLYHMKLHVGSAALLPGGYLGVDIFFVLSGYLITSILLKDLAETGRISLRTFYWRRVRRIVPPLVLVMLVSSVVAWFVLLPSELIRFATSLWAALGFVSNIYWNFQQGNYGAQSALLQPFLHTWSLAIEEQFYLVFPLLLVTIRNMRMGLILVGLTVLSLMLSVITTELAPNLSFFSPISRAWELLAGSLLAWAALRFPGALRTMPLAGAVPVLALGVIALSLCLLPLRDVAHPGLVTVPLIGATCALIWFTGTHATASTDPVTRLLSSRPFVYVGKLSYSLYLWHFPAFAFGRLYWGDPGVVHMVLLLVLAFVLSVLGYYLVERPFRFRIGGRRFFGTLASVVVALSLFTGATIFGQGFPARFTGPDTLYAGHDFDNETLRKESWAVLRDLAAAKGKSLQAREAEDLWFEDPARIQVLFVGNSFSKDLFNAFHLNRSQFEDFEFARFGLGLRLPEEEIDQLLASPNFARSDVVVITHRYVAVSLQRLPDMVQRILAAGKPVVLVGDRPEFRNKGALTPIDWYFRGAGGGTPETRHEINTIAYAMQSGVEKTATAAMMAVAADTDAIFLGLRDILCPGETCTHLTDEGRKVFYDSYHWSVAGAVAFGQRMADMNWLSPLKKMVATPLDN